MYTYESVKNPDLRIFVIVDTLLFGRFMGLESMIRG